MKIKLLLFTIFSVATTQLSAQNIRSPFRTGYFRLGINTLGKSLDNSLTPKENVFDGRYGATTGYVFEFGRLFYFQKSTPKKKINFGLDWTILSFNYNKMEKWDEYASASGVADVNISGTRIAAAVSSKLGPVVSFNAVEKLIIDVRFQVIPTIRFFDQEYYDNETEENQRSFSFTNRGREETEDGYDGESIKNRIAFGVGTGFGITVRRSAFGLSLDYITGKVNSNYDALDGQGNHTFGKEKIPVSNMQVKLSLTL